MTNVEKFHTWLCTISPKGDIDNECAQLLLRYFVKKCHFIYCVLETSDTGKLHLHASVCFKKQNSEKNIKDSCWKIVHKYHSDAVRSVAVDLHVQYDHRWKDSYLVKTDTCQVLFDNYNHEEVQKFFPSPEQQAALVRVTQTRRGDHALDPFWSKLLKGFEEYTSETSYTSALEYLRYGMYVSYQLRIVRDPRTLCQMADVLRRLRTKDISPSAEDIRWYNQQMGLCV